MLRPRLIATILLKNDIVVQSYGFSRYLPMGNLKTTVEFLSNWDIDEIVILDIDATRCRRLINLRNVEEASKKCFIPITVGGGIKTRADIRTILDAGADKICLNQQAIRNPDFISESSSYFGSQCVTVSVDTDIVDGRIQAFDYLKKTTFSSSIEELAKKIQAKGAGEILLQSRTHDGCGKGFDIDSLKSVTESVSIPVVMMGGAGHPSHFLAALSVPGCHAVCAGNMFHHTEQSTIAAKSFLRRHGVPVRLNSQVRYEDFQFDQYGRPY